jgi:ADP-ribose pyrophosphatase YjhB (NUDIX family)
LQTGVVGVAGCVIDADHRLLLVREAGRGSVVGWKLPGGLSDKGESFGETASREVRSNPSAKPGGALRPTTVRSK